MTDHFHQDAKTRFSRRVGDYVRYRPSYPDALADILLTHCDLNQNAVIADVGSGTGLFAELLLRHRLAVIGVEPNKEMRQAGEVYLQNYPGFQSVDGEANQTGLDANSIDLITVAQAFHWFDIEKFNQECRRILKPQGQVAIIYNERRTQNEFQKAYEILLEKHAIGYVDILRQHIDQKRFAEFFYNSEYESYCCDNYQDLDLPGVRGRLESSSYCPEKDHPNYEILMQELVALFNRCQKQGQIRLEYDTSLFLGRPS